MGLVDVATIGPVRLLTLHAPPANTYSYEMMRALDAAILDARMDDAVHAVVLTGAGDRFFCAGADVAMLQNATPTFKYAFCLHANETLNRMEQTPKLFVAAIGGHCVGGGLEVALACDVRIARRGTFKVGLPEVKLGVLPGTGGTARLVRLLGKSAALAMLIDGENMSVDGALARGVIDHVLDTPAAAPGERFVSAVVAWAAQRCPPHTAALSVGLMKRSVQSGAEMGFHEHLALERELQQRLFTSADAKEGLSAFAEKRPPQFAGR